MPNQTLLSLIIYPKIINSGKPLVSPNNAKVFETESTRFPIGYLAGGKQVGYLKAWPKELN